MIDDAADFGGYLAAEISSICHVFSPPVTAKRRRNLVTSFSCCAKSVVGTSMVAYVPVGICA